MTVNNTGKTAFVTGGAGGIGTAISQLLAMSGYNVAIGYNKSKEAAISLRDRLISAGANADAFFCDVTDIANVESAIDECNRKFGQIDVLVNNAGISEQKLFTDISPSEWRRMMDVNIDGVFNMTKTILPSMIRRKYGRIINVSSIWGMVGASCEVHYSTAKAAVIGFTKALAKEVAPCGITVNCVAPGVIETSMNGFLCDDEISCLKEEIPASRFGTPKEVAHCILNLADENSGYLTGQVISPNGGLVV
ncbi:MAG: 3-oxoacyl-ACP reductase FabG [Clostridiales bacterium]|nr:3-oxoacyl-ACP reductase FabG [Clostridiales bacterium]